MVEKTNKQKAYWKENLKLIKILLFIWALVSLVFVVLLGDVLSEINFFGVNLSFWFGQQGSILIFLILLIVYAVRMDRLDKKYGVNEDAITEKGENTT